MKYILNLFFILFDFFTCRIPLWYGRYKSKEYVYTITNGRKIKLDLYLPAESNKPHPVVLYIHGGGWEVGYKKLIQPGIIRQVRRGYAVVSIDYSLSFKAKWPVQAHEAKAAVRWIRANAEKFNLNSGCIIPWGVSAGGHIASILGTSHGVELLEGNTEDNKESSEVQGVVSWYGISDFMQMGHGGFYAKIFYQVASRLMGVNILDHPEAVKNANPITFISPDNPPFLIMHGTHDRIINIHQSEILHSALLKAGVKSIFIPLDGYAHSDIRFNKSAHIKKVEAFIDGISGINNEILQ